MRKTTTTENDYKIAVDINGLQSMLSVGKNTASEVGEKAGAVIRLGKRKLYNVKRVEMYLDSITEGV
ncbi:MAG: hypothetical protein MJ066_05790 [Clostridia bacterium]|nr:hypothetical protein [Clostridia bacterium]